MLISERAAEAVGNSWAEVPLVNNPSRLSDHQLRKQEAAADVVSTVASDRERLRREQDRRQASGRIPSGASASAALAAELFNWYSDGDEHGAFQDGEAQLMSVSVARHASASDQKHYQFELDRLVNIDQTEEAQNLETMLQRAGPARGRGGGDRGGRGSRRSRYADQQRQRGGGGGGEARSSSRGGGRGRGRSGNRDDRAKVTTTRLYDSD